MAFSILRSVVIPNGYFNTEGSLLDAANNVAYFASWKTLLKIDIQTLTLISSTNVGEQINYILEDQDTIILICSNSIIQRRDKNTLALLAQYTNISAGRGVFAGGYFYHGSVTGNPAIHKRDAATFALIAQFDIIPNISYAYQTFLDGNNVYVVGDKENNGTIRAGRFTLSPFQWQETIEVGNGWIGGNVVFDSINKKLFVGMWASPSSIMKISAIPGMSIIGSNTTVPSSNNISVGAIDLANNRSFWGTQEDPSRIFIINNDTLETNEVFTHTAPFCRQRIMLINDTNPSDIRIYFAGEGSTEIFELATTPPPPILTVPTNLTATLAPKEIPVASFSYKQGATWQDIEFLDLSLKQPTSWLWSFGDGTTSTQQNPTHTYATAGDKTVRLTVTNANGTHFVEQVVSIVKPPEITAGYGTSKTSAGLKVSFQASAVNGTTVTSWLWSFGDGTTSTLQNPSKTYGTKGTYIVTVSGKNASSSTSKSFAISYT